MIFGWVFFIINVSLFYFGISDYRKFVICFLFEILDRVLLGNIFKIIIFSFVYIFNYF